MGSGISLVKGNQNAVSSKVAITGNINGSSVKNIDNDDKNEILLPNFKKVEKSCSLSDVSDDTASNYFSEEDEEETYESITEKNSLFHFFRQNLRQNKTKSSVYVSDRVAVLKPQRRRSNIIDYGFGENISQCSSNDVDFYSFNNSLEKLPQNYMSTPVKSSSHFKLKRHVTFSNATGHEHPYSIKMSHVRDSLKGDGSETPVIVDKDLNDNSINCQFILRETKKVQSKVNLDENQRKKSKVKKSPLSFWKKRHRDPSPSAAPTGKLFGHPLAQVFTDDNELPKPIHAMLYYLFVHGPFTSGIFRKPANSKCVRDLREKLDSNDDCTIDEINPLVVASTLKEYLRSLPDCLLLRELYPMWLETMEMDNANEMIKALQHVFMRLPQKNSIVLRHLMCVLYHINKRAEENSMTAYNLAVCISQSLLWINITDSVDLVQQSEAMEKVPKLIQFMVDHCTEVFGEDTVTLFGDPVTSKQRGDSSTDSDSMNSLLSGGPFPNGQSKRDDSSIDSLEHFIDIESSPGARKSHLSPTNLSRDSGLCSSDNQLNDFNEDYHETDNARSNAKPRITRTMSHEPDTKHQKGRNINPLSHSYDSEMDSVSRIDSGVVYPKAPPRNKKKSESPSSDLSCQKTVNRMPTVYSDVELRMHHVSSDQSLMRRPAGRGMPKRSTDSALGSSIGSSLGSVEESSEASHDELLDFQSKHKDLGTLQKSESGATLYLENDSLVNQGGLAEIYKHSGALNHDSIQEEMNYGKQTAYHHSIKRNNGSKSSNLLDSQPPSTRHSWDGMLDNKKKHTAHKTTKLTSLKTKSNFSLSPHESLDEETEDEVRKSLYDGEPSVLNTSTLTENKPVQKIKSNVQVNDTIQTTPVSSRAPSLKNLKSQSLDSYESYVQYPHQTAVLDKSSSDMSRIKHSPVDVNRAPSSRHYNKGMTSKGSDLFPKQVRRILQSPLSSASSEQLQIVTTHASKASMHHSTSPRSKSSSRTDYEDHNSQAKQRGRQTSLKHEKYLERSSSDTRVAQQFAHVQKLAHLPSYQEAMKRKGLYNSRSVEVSDDQVVQQREASARARKLYEESQKRYSEEQKQKDYAYFSEPEAVAQSRENAVRENKSKEMKQPPCYEMACKRSEELKEQRRSQQGYPPNYHDIKKGMYSKDNIALIKYSISSRDGTSVYTDGDRERTPTLNEGSGMTTNEGKRRSKSRERREGQRLSDTRLENNRRKKKGTSLSRSKSDSSEHLNKVYKLRAQDSTDSEDDWPPVHRTRRISKSASKERLQNFDIHKRPKSADAATLLRQLQESGLDILEPGYTGNSVHNRHTLRRNTTVKNKGWHKELAEKYDGKKGRVFYQPDDIKRSEPKFIITYSKQVSNESDEHVIDEERPKRRWVPPPHPTKDLVIIRNNDKDGGLNRSSSNVTSNKKSKPFLTREMRANTLTHIDSIPNDSEISSSQHVPMQSNSRISNDNNGQHNSNNHSSRNNKNSHQHLRDYPYRHSDSPVSTNSEREDSDNEEHRGLTWSVSKLRAKYDTPSPKSNNQTASNSAKSSNSGAYPPHFYSPNSQPPQNLRNSRDHFSNHSLVSQTGHRGSLQQQQQQRVMRVYGSDVSNPNAEEHYI